jgi:hypothetical protein
MLIVRRERIKNMMGLVAIGIRYRDVGSTSPNGVTQLRASTHPPKSTGVVNLGSECAAQ